VPLLDAENNPITTVPKAVIARAALLAGVSKGVLPGPRITPKFREYVVHYFTFLESTSSKSPLTMARERGSLNHWVKFLGDIRLNQITRPQVNEFVMLRSGEVSNRSVNLDMIAMRNLLVFAKEEGWLHNGLPTDGLKALKHTCATRSLMSEDALERLCAAATAKNADGTPKHVSGLLLADFMKLLE